MPNTLYPMKLHLLTGTLMCLMLGCSTPTDDNAEAQQEEKASDAMQIHFQSGFYQDTVSLFHGKKKIYEKVLTTEEGNKLTDKVSLPKEELTDTLYFRVAQAGRVLKGFIPPNAEQYVGFYLTSGTAVNIYSKDTPFSY
jgi:hypothetical protein